jgi:hypothetical protein
LVITDANVLDFSVPGHQDSDDPSDVSGKIDQFSGQTSGHRLFRGNTAAMELF